MSSIKQISAADNRHVYGVTSSKVYYTYADPSPTPTSIYTPTPTPIGYKTPLPTSTPAPGPIAGRVYDRETGIGISGVYIRALPTEAGQIPDSALSGPGGYYTTGNLDLGTYELYADTNQTSGFYRNQWYNQKDTQRFATEVYSNTAGIDFPLYEVGKYPTPTPAPTPDYSESFVSSGDYDGDGLSDIAVFRGSSGLWAIRALTRAYFGRDGDIPVSGDYDGDGTADIAVFRQSSGLWAVRALTRAYFGAAGDLPIPADYDGDGYCDPGIFRDGSGLWAIRGLTRLYFGGTGDQPVPGDYDGDGFADQAIFRNGSGLWALRDISRIYFGQFIGSAGSRRL